MKTLVQELGDFGQSIWLDYISRPLLRTGKLKAMLEFGLLGMTSNPTIFNEAISTHTAYDEQIVKLAEAGKKPFDTYDAITIQDIQEAADIFRGVYEKTKFLDGYVSLEINPKLAMDTQGSIKEGLRLFKTVKRPNVMIKVPATDPGFPVITELLSQGVSVNVTLIFSLQQYEKTVQAYFSGIEKLLKMTKDLSRIRSVASVFVSRIDTQVDNALDQKMTQEQDEANKKQMQSLKGKTAIANCAVIYQRFQSFFSKNTLPCPVQRVLWGSTGTKNPLYSDIKYVSELITKDTVNTLPEKTINAFLDHGHVKAALTDSREALVILGALRRYGIDIDQVCTKLLIDGVAAFEKSFDALIATIDQKARNLCAKN